MTQATHMSIWLCISTHTYTQFTHTQTHLMKGNDWLSTICQCIALILAYVNDVMTSFSVSTAARDIHDKE